MDTIKKISFFFHLNVILRVNYLKNYNYDPDIKLLYKTYINAFRLILTVKLICIV